MKKDINYLLYDIFKKNSGKKYSNCNENRPNTFIECIQKTKPLKDCMWIHLHRFILIIFQ